jgi:hypothetical protein
MLISPEEGTPYAVGSVDLNIGTDVTVGRRTSKATILVAGLLAGAILTALALQGSPFADRGTVEVPYPAGEVHEVRVLGAVDVRVDGEPKLGASVFGAIALFMLATASFVTFAALRMAGARRQIRALWLIAAAGLAVAAADELLAIHETVGHNLPQLADVPGVKRPDDLLMLLYLPAVMTFAWAFRDVLRERRLTYVCLSAAGGCFVLSIAADLASVHIEEWFELLAGLFIAAGLIALMHQHLARNLQIRVRAAAPTSSLGGALAQEQVAEQPVGGLEILGTHAGRRPLGRSRTAREL